MNCSLASSRLLLALGLGLGLALTSGKATAQTESWPQLVSAAQKEGKLVIYNGSSPGLTDVVARGFTKKYGIEVVRLDARPAEVRERIRSEHAAGRFAGDVTISISETLKRQVSDGVLQEHGFIPAAKTARPEWSSDGTVLPFAIVRWAILVNNAAVPEGSEPRSWADLLDPKWKGKILMDDPRTNGGGHFMFTATYKRFGREFHEKLAAQRPVLSSNISLNERRTAQGEYAIYLPQVVPNLGRLNGLPVRGITPAEGLPYGASAAAMLKRAPNPNAARLFLDYVLSDEAQDGIAAQGYAVATTHASDKTPARVKGLVDAALLGTATAAEAETMLKLAGEIYK
ncbi:MAG: ABC transporter substrate-binding protein [Burkholderiaceae bacterium]